MAKFDKLSDAAINQVAARTGEWLSTTPRFKNLVGKRVEIAESFQVWRLSLDSFAQSKLPLNQLIKNTGRWHHQIRSGGQSVAFARSISSGQDQQDWKLMQLVESSLVKKIDDAIQWIDAQVFPDATVRLLLIPAYQVNAFWLDDPRSRSVVLIDFPQAFDQLKTQRVYSPAEFRAALLSRPFVPGIPKDLPDWNPND